MLCRHTLLLEQLHILLLDRVERENPTLPVLSHVFGWSLSIQRHWEGFRATLRSLLMILDFTPVVTEKAVGDTVAMKGRSSPFCFFYDFMPYMDALGNEFQKWDIVTCIKGSIIRTYGSFPDCGKTYIPFPSWSKLPLNYIHAAHSNTTLEHVPQELCSICGWRWKDHHVSYGLFKMQNLMNEVKEEIGSVGLRLLPEHEPAIVPFKY